MSKSKIVIWLNNEVSLEFAYCPPGKFRMGHASAPVHRAHDISINTGYGKMGTSEQKVYLSKVLTL